MPSGRSFSTPSSGARRRSACASSPRPRSTAPVSIARTSRASVRSSTTCIRPRRRASSTASAAAPRDRGRRLPQRRDRGRFDRREGRARPCDAPDGRSLSALWLRLARRLHHARALARRARLRAVAAPSPLLPGPLLPGRVWRNGRRSGVNRGERRALLHYRLRGYRLLEANARAGGYELDLVLRRGRRLVVVEVKEKGGPDFGHPLEMIHPEKARRVRAATSAWLAAHPETAGLDIAMEAAGVQGRRLARVPLVWG